MKLEWMLVAFVLLAFVIPFARRMVVRPGTAEPGYLKILEYGALLVLAVGFLSIMAHVLWVASLMVMIAVILAVVWYLAARSRAVR